MAGKSRPVVIVMSILAALQFLFGGLATVNLGSQGNETILAIGAIGTLAVAAAQAGLQFYVQNLVVPVIDVAAYKDKDGELVAGPAATPPAVRDEPVNVTSESAVAAATEAEPQYENLGDSDTRY